MDSVPSFFICPISLQIMKDPVIICTGMTFDRSSIQKWLFSYKHKTCPVTNQPLSDFTLIPNCNLLRLIHSWQLHTPSKAIDQNPINANSPIPSFTTLVEEIKQPHLQLKTLKKIKTLISNKSLHISDDVLFSCVASVIPKPDGLSPDLTVNIDETVSLLCLLKPSEESLKAVSENENGILTSSLCTIMTKYLHTHIRIQSAILLDSVFEVVEGVYKEELKPELFETMAEILKDQNSRNGSMAVLRILIQVLEFGRNKRKAIKVGVVQILVELLAEKSERRASEMMLVVLEMLCRKAEGRAAFMAHPMGVAAVSSMIVRVPLQNVGIDRAIKLLLQIVRYCKSNDVAEELMEVGAACKVWMVIQSGCDSKTKLRAMEILGFLKTNWTSSPCLASSFDNGRS